MTVLAIDPGPEQSAYVLLRRSYVPEIVGIVDNFALLDAMRNWAARDVPVPAIEMISSYGMPVGKDVFETCVWIGRLIEAWHGQPTLPRFVYRRDVKLHLCNSARAKDANVRQALIDRYGGSKQKAVGTKRQPGPLHGFKSHLWSALAVGVTYLDQLKEAA